MNKWYFDKFQSVSVCVRDCAFGESIEECSVWGAVQLFSLVGTGHTGDIWPKNDPRKETNPTNTAVIRIRAHNLEILSELL